MIFVFLADGFEEIEALTPVDYLRRCGLNVKTVGVGNEIISGAHGIPVVADVLIEDIDISLAEMIILPGGMPGTINLEKSERLKSMISFAANNNIRIAAICAAPSILGHMGLLKGKKAVCFTGFEDELDCESIPNDICVTDGIITTAVSAGNANQFAFELVRLLCGSERAEKLKEGLLWQK